MSSRISSRFITSTILALALLSLFSVYSFAQELENTLQQTRTTQTRAVRENVSDMVAEKRAAMQQRNVAAREKFSEDLAAITDETKKAIVERLNTKLQTMNEAKTTRWASALDTLSEILTRIETNINVLKDSGVDTTSADTLVAGAKEAIESASVLVTTQAENSYVIEITDEATLRESIQPVVQKFKEDLRATLASVKTARDAVRLAARGLAALNTVPAENEQQTLDLQPDSGSDIIQ